MWFDLSSFISHKLDSPLLKHWKQKQKCVSSREPVVWKITSRMNLCGTYDDFKWKSLTLRFSLALFRSHLSRKIISRRCWKAYKYVASGAKEKRKTFLLRILSLSLSFRGNVVCPSFCHREFSLFKESRVKEETSSGRKKKHETVKWSKLGKCERISFWSLKIYANHSQKGRKRLKREKEKESVLSGDGKK